MASTLYVDFQQPAINAAWLNDVNRTQYTLLGNPTSTNDIRVALGIAAPALATATSVSAATQVTGILPIANGGTGDTGTAWTVFSGGTVSSTSGTGAAGTIAGKYKTIGKTVFISLTVVISASGTAAGNYITSSGAVPVLPLAANSVLFMREASLTGTTGFCVIASNGGMTIGRYDNSITGYTTGSQFLISGSYESV